MTFSLHSPAGMRGEIGEPAVVSLVVADILGELREESGHVHTEDGGLGEMRKPLARRDELCLGFKWCLKVTTKGPALPGRLGRYTVKSRLHRGHDTAGTE